MSTLLSPPIFEKVWNEKWTDKLRLSIMGQKRCREIIQSAINQGKTKIIFCPLFWEEIVSAEQKSSIFGTNLINWTLANKKEIIVIVRINVFLVNYSKRLNLCVTFDFKCHYSTPAIKSDTFDIFFLFILLE